MITGTTGQVHRAIWKETGEEVVVKVKYPDSEQLFRTDMSTMRTFSRLAQPENLPAINELERQFLKEFDLSNEGRALEIVRRNIEPHYATVRIPRPVYYNSDILVMQFLPGRKLMDSCMDDYRRYAQRLGMSLEELMDLSKRNYGKPLPIGWRNYLRLGVEDAISTTTKTAQYGLALLYNNTVGWVIDKRNLWQYPRLGPLIRPDKALQTLLQVHAHEIFVDGLFNGDPHSGNILLMPDGRLGLIDYGQVKELAVEQRKKLAEFVVAVADNDRERIVDMMYGIGYRTEKMDRDVAYRTAKLVFDRDDLEATDGKGFQMYLAALDQQDRITSVPDDYIMVSRVCLLLRGIGMLLGVPPVSVAQQWKPICEQVIASNVLREPELTLTSSESVSHNRP